MEVNEAPKASSMFELNFASVFAYKLLTYLNDAFIVFLATILYTVLECQPESDDLGTYIIMLLIATIRTIGCWSHDIIIETFAYTCSWFVCKAYNDYKKYIKKSFSAYDT